MRGKSQKAARKIGFCLSEIIVFLFVFSELSTSSLFAFDPVEGVASVNPPTLSIEDAQVRQPPGNDFIRHKPSHFFTEGSAVLFPTSVDQEMKEKIELRIREDLESNFGLPPEILEDQNALDIKIKNEKNMTTVSFSSVVQHVHPDAYFAKFFRLDGFPQKIYYRFQQDPNDRKNYRLVSGAFHIRAGMVLFQYPYEDRPVTILDLKDELGLTRGMDFLLSARIPYAVIRNPNPLAMEIAKLHEKATDRDVAIYGEVPRKDGKSWFPEVLYSIPGSHFMGRRYYSAVAFADEGGWNIFEPISAAKEDAFRAAAFHELKKMNPDLTYQDIRLVEARKKRMGFSWYEEFYDLVFMVRDMGKILGKSIRKNKNHEWIYTFELHLTS